MKGRRVLIAEDQPLVLSAVTALLKDSFDVVAMVSDGCVALEETLKLRPELLVLDVSMPGMNGIEVAKELKRLGNDAKIVFLTVHQETYILASCFAAGGLGYVVKMFMDSDLIPAMSEALAGRVFVSRFSSNQETS